MVGEIIACPSSGFTFKNCLCLDFCWSNFEIRERGLQGKSSKRRKKRDSRRRRELVWKGAAAAAAAMADLAWFNKDGLEKFFLEKYTEEGELKADAEPLGQGTFACVYQAGTAGGSDGLVLRVVNARVSAAGDQCFAKEVLAVRAFLKLRGESDVPEVGKVVMLDEAKQPPGLCPIFCYLIVNEEGSGVRKIFTVMPKAIPIMTVIEGQLQAAEAGGENATRDLSQLVKWMSQVACGMRFMHKKGVFWRDCKLDNIVLVNGDAKIIDISSGVCTVGYASHEQLVKLDLSAEAICNNQMITDALEQA